MVFAGVYPLYIQKVEKKGRTKAELDEIIFWLTGYNEQTLRMQIENRANFKTFFEQAPQYNQNASKISGTICGVRIEDIEDEVVKKVRCLDKLVDELAKGKEMNKILRP